MNNYVINSKYLNEKYHLDVIKYNFASTISSVGNKNPKKFLFLLKYAFILIYKLLFMRPNLVYFTINPLGLPFYRDLVIVSLIKLFKAKLVYHLHGKGIKDVYYKHKKAYDYAYHNVNVICLSKYLKEDVFFLKREPFIVSNGISFDCEKRNKRNRTNIVKILYLSTCGKAKGTLDLIDACAILKEKKIKFELHLVGQYGITINEEFLTKYIQEKRLTDVAYIHGPKYGKEKEAFFSEADIFVLPSHNEALPLVLIEASQYGIPSISTRVGGIMDIIEDNVTGLLFEKKNIQELASKLEYLINDEEKRKEMGQKAYEKCKSQFSLSDFEYHLGDVFNKIIINT